MDDKSFLFLNWAKQAFQVGPVGTLPAILVQASPSYWRSIVLTVWCEFELCSEEEGEGRESSGNSWCLYQTLSIILCKDYSGVRSGLGIGPGVALASQILWMLCGCWLVGMYPSIMRHILFSLPSPVQVLLWLVLLSQSLKWSRLTLNFWIHAVAHLLRTGVMDESHHSQPPPSHSLALEHDIGR